MGLPWPHSPNHCNSVSSSSSLSCLPPSPSKLPSSLFPNSLPLSSQISLLSPSKLPSSLVSISSPPLLLTLLTCMTTISPGLASSLPNSVSSLSLPSCTTVQTRAVKSRRGRGQEGDRVEEKERSGGERKEGKKGKSDIACYRALYFTHTGHVTDSPIRKSPSELYMHLHTNEGQRSPHL